MKFAVIGEVLGDDRLLTDLLADLSRQGIARESVVCLGNLVGPWGDSLRCLELASTFGACLQGPMERELLQRGGTALGPHALQPVWDTLQGIEPGLLETIGEWPPQLVTPPYAFLDFPERALRLPESVRVRFISSRELYWIPGNGEAFTRAMLEHPGETRDAETDDEEEPASDVVVPADGDEWELTLPGALPATVFVGSVPGLQPQAVPVSRRVVGAWIVDERYLRFLCREHDTG